MLFRAVLFGADRRPKVPHSDNAYAWTPALHEESDYFGKDNQYITVPSNRWPDGHLLTSARRRIALAFPRWWFYVWVHVPAEVAPPPHGFGMGPPPPGGVGDAVI